MMNRGLLSAIAIALAFQTSGLVAGTGTDPDGTDSLIRLQRAFTHPPEDCKIMMRWWWFGPSATKAELEREMRLMKDSGIGGFEIQPVYPLSLDDPDRGFRNSPFLSDEFIEALRFTSSAAHELGLRTDLTLGSGWPYGGPDIPITQAAGKLRFEAIEVNPGTRRMPLPYISNGEKLIAAFLAEGNRKKFVARSAREVTTLQDGAVQLPQDLQGPHALLFFVASRTGQMVKRAAVGAEGFVLDHYDQAAMDNYLRSVGDRLMQAFGSSPPRAIFCDSLEVYESDWTSNLLEEFQRRRGYDLKPFLPALVGDIGEETGAIRHDWGETLTELLEEHFVQPLEKWARDHGTLLRAQSYGIPPAILSTNELVDLPEGEGAHWKTFTPTRWASSASHIFGRPVTSSETWTWLHSPAFRATPLDLKAEADVHFLEGVNQLVGHGWPYSPPEAGEPGWRFYAAGALNEHNPWWRVFPDIALYLQRVSFMLRQGKPANEVAIYLPTADAWARFSLGNATVSEAMEGLLGPRLIAALLEAGYGFDFIDDRALIKFGRMEQGHLAANENQYSMIILPGVERIPPGTFEKLEDFAQQGGILVATRRTPSLAPGFMDSQTEATHIRKISQELFVGANAPAHFVRNEDRELASKLRALLSPTVAFSPPETQIGFVRRKTQTEEIYFLANTGNEARSTRATFRVKDMQPEWWDAFSGKVHAASVLARDSEGTTIALDLPAYGSMLLVFSKRQQSHNAVSNLSDIPPPIDLSTEWKVTFGRTGRSILMDRLRSWTDDEETRFFSGEATYEKTVTIPADFIQPRLEVCLDFGEGTRVPETAQARLGTRAWLESPVRDAAEVYVNDRRAGSVWHPPYLVDVTELLHPGENNIRVIVGNLAINKMAGSSLPDYRLLNSRYGERFTPQDMQNLEPLPSGMLGTIRLVARQAQPSQAEQ